jgi:hypothetical protein
MLIAELADGVVLKSTNLQPGEITKMSMVPDNYIVQKISTHTFQFTTSSRVKGDAAVTIRLPAGIIPPLEGTVLTDVSSPDGSTSATRAVVLAGNQIQVFGLTKPGQILRADSTITLRIKGLKNQFSAKDAGDFTITTQNKIGDQYYTVDESTSPTSFVA